MLFNEPAALGSPFVADPVGCKEVETLAKMPASWVELVAKGAADAAVVDTP